MLMGIPITMGLLSSQFARGLRGVGSSLRERVLWFSSADASRLLILIGAVAAMTLSLILTMSRSGVSAAALAIAIFVLSFRGHRTRARRFAAVATVTILVAVVVAWAGTTAIATRFSSAEAGLEGRIGAWGDAWRIARLYPMAGTGLNTYAVAMHFHQRFDPSKRYPQAHNDYLQLAAEGGLLLSVPALICISVFVSLVIRRLAQKADEASHWIRMGSVTGLVAIALQATADFSLQMPGNAFLFAVLCAIALHRARNGGREMWA
jgi:O-antigen ligase